ncbi:MAG: SWIM zinc finger family protein [Chitinophagaceae bacterium]
MQLSEDQIFALAPDEASKKAGKDLSTANKWVSKGMNEQAIWGECQGSGSKPYQTQIDIASLTFKCSCPSRKFPCKHGLGLLLFHAKQQGSFTEKIAPQWVADWLAKRSERAEKKTEQKDKPVDEAAQTKRLQAREQLIDEGIEDLLLWMKDIVRNGILSIPENGTLIFDELAKRMVDAKAAGLANMLKGLSNINYYKEGWQHVFMQQLCNIYIIISGYKQKNKLNEAILEDVKKSIGFTQNQESLKQLSGIEDNWFVLGKQLTEEDSVTIEHNWLYGIVSKKYALVLQFSVRGQGINFSLTPGKVINSELVFFPSVSPLRAIIKNHALINNASLIDGYSNWLDVSQELATIHSTLPVQGSLPFIINQVSPVFYNNQWWLKDINNNLVQLPDGYAQLYNLLAITGGKPFNMAVIAKQHIFTPIGAWVNQQYISI